MEQILIAHDGSKPSERALKKGVEIAERFSAAVTVIGVVPEIYLTELIDMDRMRIFESLNDEAKKIMDEVRKKYGDVKSLTTVIKQGSPAEEILKEAQRIKADLIVTGSHGRHGAQKFLLGSVSSKIVDHAECDVMVVKK